MLLLYTAREPNGYYNVVAARDLFITSDFHRVCSQFFCLFFLFSFPFRVIRRGRLPCTVPLHAFLYIRSINNYYTTRPLNYYRACYNVLLKKKRVADAARGTHKKILKNKISDLFRELFSIVGRGFFFFHHARCYVETSLYLVAKSYRSNLITTRYRDTSWARAKI